VDHADGYRPTQGAAREAMDHLDHVNRERHRLDGEEQRALADGENAKKDNAGQVADSVDDGSGRHLARHRSDRAVAQRETARRFGPALGRQRTAKNGPKPVCMLSTNWLSQSSPRGGRYHGPLDATVLSGPDHFGGLVIC